ncbi:NAD(P)-dependent oxidoreductase [Betaproteobacteria bacterium]|nr:NAD(P)-dependent oxidoreductase [Betaproteobacteria bacterium]GHT98842.1 NAD(P)-dependent oxidoreductase [Betaproteobacteria bacterium]GHU02620.1 NAD(P)-dependent oxidoreductase [Betaproteobacteria bacterium]GHU14304.1 NAD(P)-dependent oxidoreductase [Betaproteobacteria bacterium]GHU16559.1 NAD(P)-dependent oxidoreductase [Betaproteobacteria bacterium]
MKILLLGASGQVGWELQRALAPLGALVALDRQPRDGLVGDLTDEDGLRATVARVAPDVIVNAAAHTAVDRAESEPGLARQINATALELLGAEARTRGAWLVHYSTDYVFDGSGDHARREDAPTGPLSVYGRTKLEGEDAIRASACRHLILRTSWVYAARGGNFARTMLKLAAERERLSVIFDQIGAPTGAELIADVTAQLVAQVTRTRDDSLSGVYHLVARGETSWHGYARFVIDEARKRGATLKVDEIAPIPSSAYPTPAARPANSRLDTTRLRTTFGLNLPDWRLGVGRMLDEILT